MPAANQAKGRMKQATYSEFAPPANGVVPGAPLEGVRHSARRPPCDSLTPAMRWIPGISLAFGLSVLGLVACSTATQVKSLAAPEVPTRYVLHNGVRVLIQEYPSSEAVAVQLWVRAGGRDEAPTELGLAHYLEHMLFKGTTTRSKGFVDRDVEGVGGRMNAGTSHDYTFYHAVLPASRAVPTIEMLTDISVNSILDETELELEKKSSSRKCG